MLSKEIIILANSVKHHNRCVAGKCLNTGEWVRPVAGANGEALSVDQTRCRNPHGTFPAKTLQRVLMNFETVVPLINQPENHLIAANSEWRQNFNIGEHQLPQLLDEPISLWGQGSRVSYDAIAQSQYNPMQSLFLVQTSSLRLYYNTDSKRRVSFIYNQVSYDLPATDPRYDKIFNAQEDLQGILCISLGENHNGFCYKIAAAIY